jgi:polyisoprenoid-binding protein YceI
LRSPKFLDVEKFPTLTFKSKRVETAGAGKLKVTGDLRIHGVTKEVALDVERLTEAMKDQRGNLHMGTSATTTINRRDFGITSLPAAMVSDDIAITLDVELVKRVPRPHERYRVDPPLGSAALGCGPLARSHGQ